MKALRIRQLNSFSSDNLGITATSCFDVAIFKNTRNPIPKICPIATLDVHELRFLGPRRPKIGHGKCQCGARAHFFLTIELFSLYCIDKQDEVCCSLCSRPRLRYVCACRVVPLCRCINFWLNNNDWAVGFQDIFSTMSFTGSRFHLSTLLYQSLTN